MKLDLTKKIILDEKNQKTYHWTQFFSYFGAIILFLFLTYRILFPTEYFNFSFANVSSLKNTITDINDETGKLPDKGILSSGKMSFFSSPFSADQSEAKIIITLDKKSAPLKKGGVTLQKSFKAFFYPSGEKIDLNKNNIFQNDFSDGSVVTYGSGAYVISGSQISPIDSLATFQALGYDWADVKPISADVFSRYEKGKLITMSSAHPDGTILVDSENNYYLIRDGKKIRLEPTEKIQSELPRNPILVSSESLDETMEKICYLKKDMLSLRSYSCVISVDDLKKLLGKDYRFQLETENSIQIDTIAVQFKKNPTVDNIKLTISTIWQRIKNNYGAQNAQ